MIKKQNFGKVDKLKPKKKKPNKPNCNSSKKLESKLNNNNKEHKNHQFEMMVNNLVKAKKESKLFIEVIGKYKKIVVYKDFQIKLIINKKELQTPVRYKIGIWEEIENTLKKNPTDFSYLKDNFEEWLKNKKQDNITEEIQEYVDVVFSKIPNKYNSQIPLLVEKITMDMRKTTRQYGGFIEKLDSIYKRWLNQAVEIEKIKTIEAKIRIDSYEQTFPLARALRRKIIINIGPTNSGKTHNSLNVLAEAKKGIYLAPLRLMAAEGKEALEARGIKCDLVTGEEQIISEESTHISSTVEMCEFNSRLDVAVIDEIQMISDPHRGWAWSQALIGVSANTVILVGSEEALPYILPILDNLGEEYTINKFERKTPLKTRSSLWRFNELRQGDAIVVFSRKEALAKKIEVESYGKTCSIIYGNLSPEVRRSEANRFRKNETEVLIATDAIGMGLNLPIQRLFLNKIEKFDGLAMRNLTVSEIKQIGGRAGRYGLSKAGEVGLLSNDREDHYQYLNIAIHGGYEKALDNRIYISPNMNQLEIICKNIGNQDIYSGLIFFKEKLIKDHENYKAANIDNMIEVAGIVNKKNLGFREKFNYCCVPIDTNNEAHLNYINIWSEEHSKGEIVLPLEVPDSIKNNPNDLYTLYEAEMFVKLCMAYNWLHYRYPITFAELEKSQYNARVANDYIERYLTMTIKASKKGKKQ